MLYAFLGWVLVGRGQSAYNSDTVKYERQKGQNCGLTIEAG